MNFTFKGAGHYFMLGISMFENAFRAEHFCITLAVKFHFFIFMYITVSRVSTLGALATILGVGLSHG
jgi:hypothetical protein